MKILKLSLQGFTCYREPTEIDFSELELFAITGATGSGKSSLIDAVIFALYGKVPRVTTDVNSLISHNEQQMSVLLEFKVGDQLYKIARKVHLKKSTQAILDKWDNEWKDLASGVRQVNQKIIEIIGLDYDSFTRCIILPQGAFAQFLLDAKSRQDILTRLLNLEILGKMQKKASQNYEEVKKEICLLQIRLENEFADAVPAEIEKLHQEYVNIDKETHLLNNQYNNLSDIYNEQKELVHLWDNRTHLQGKHQRYLPRLEQIQVLEKKIEKANSVLPFFPKIENLETQKIKLNKMQQLFEAQQKKVNNLKLELENKEGILGNAEKDWNNLPEYEQKILEVRKVLQVSETLEKENALLQQKQKTQNEDILLCQKITAELKEIESNIVKLTTKNIEVEANIQKTEKNIEKWHKYKEMQNYIALLEEAKQNYQEREEQLQQLQLSLKNYQKAYKKINSKHEKVDSNIQKIKKSLEELGDKDLLVEQLQNIEKAKEIQEKLVVEEQQKDKELSKLGQEQQECKKITENITSIKNKIKILQKDLNSKQEQLEITTKLYEELSPIYQLFIEVQAIVEENNKKIDDVTKELHTNKKEKKKQQKSLNKHEKDLKKFTSEFEEIKSSWEILHKKNLAHTLREHLHKGDDCPVCNQTIEKLPKTTEDDTKIKEELLKCETSMEKQQQKIDSTQKKITEYQIALQYLENEEQKYEEEISFLKEEQKKQLEVYTSHEQKLMNGLQAEDKSQIAQAIKTLYEYIKEVDKEKDHLSQNLTYEEGNKREQEAILKTIQSRQEERQEKIQTIDKEIKNLKKNLQNLLGKKGEKWFLEEETIRTKIIAIKEQQQKLQSSEKEFLDITLEKNNAKQKCDETNRAIDQSKLDLDKSNHSWQEKQDMLRKELNTDASNIEQVLLEGIQKHQKETEKCKLLKTQLDEMRNEIQENKLQETKKNATLENLEEEIKERKKDIDTLTDENHKMKNEIESVTEGKNPKTLLKNLQKQEHDIRSFYQEIRESYVLVAQSLQTSKEEWQKQKSDIQEATEQFETLKNEMDKYLQKVGFSSYEEFHKIKVPPHILEDWQQEVKNFYKEFHEIEAQLNYCNEQLAGREVNRENMDDNAQKLQELQKIIGEKIHTKGVMENQLKRLNKNIEEVDNINQKLEVLHSRETITKQLALDLRANNFQMYVLEEALQTLAEDANIQMDILSGGRYSFFVEKREFYVIDHWHDDQVRLVKTLSGGETFVASLSLALALAERIYQLGSNMGANCTLESLFLDEGFGTLDEEHLDMVVKALNNLQGTGRTIGIISHLPVLNNYLPIRLVIEKNRENSQVFYEHN